MSEAMWPLPAFSFQVDLGQGPIAFSEVAGLVSEVLADGTERHGPVAMTRGIFAGDLTLPVWFDAARADPAAHRTVTIDLLDEQGRAARRWTLHGARPVKLRGPVLRNDGNEVATETLEIACERLTASAP